MARLRVREAAVGLGDARRFGPIVKRSVLHGGYLLGRMYMWTKVDLEIWRIDSQIGTCVY